MSGNFWFLQKAILLQSESHFCASGLRWRHKWLQHKHIWFSLTEGDGVGSIHYNAPVVCDVKRCLDDNQSDQFGSDDLGLLMSSGYFRLVGWDRNLLAPVVKRCEALQRFPETACSQHLFFPPLQMIKRNINNVRRMTSHPTLPYCKSDWCLSGS